MKNNEIAGKLANLASTLVDTRTSLIQARNAQLDHRSWIAKLDGRVTTLELQRQDKVANSLRLDNHESMLDKNEKDHIYMVDRMNKLEERVGRLDGIVKNHKGRLDSMDFLGSTIESYRLHFADQITKLEEQFAVLDKSQKYIHDKVAVLHKDIREASPTAEEEPYEPSNAEILAAIKRYSLIAFAIIVGSVALTGLLEIILNLHP